MLFQLFKWMPESSRPFVLYSLMGLNMPPPFSPIAPIIEWEMCPALQAFGGGGAIFANGEKLRISRSFFEGNVANVSLLSGNEQVCPSSYSLFFLLFDCVLSAA